MTGVLVRITARHFCAGLVVRDGRVVEAAPILRWTVGKLSADVREHGRRRGWKMERLP